MLYAKVIDGVLDRYPYSQTDLTRENPNTSFPNGLMSPAALAEWDVYPVQYTQAPSFDPNSEKLIEATPINVGGSWVQQWSVIPLTQDEIDARLSAQWSVIRDQRNEKLSACDWTQLPDCPLTNTKQTEWATYRQALRDVTQQADPFNITWPVQPE